MAAGLSGLLLAELPHPLTQGQPGLGSATCPAARVSSPPAGQTPGKRAGTASWSASTPAAVPVSGAKDLSSGLKGRFDSDWHASSGTETPQSGDRG